ncbi:complement factor H-like isoform X2 [Mugil cephalus]|uniref:complement factor H-like isoform X2 n=1 Tax=Mugil cephalus TaxID=48193 RepID=UPI001FB65915|nr:complement factor H-like isoform X2 [Mugil cephalus]
MCVRFLGLLLVWFPGVLHAQTTSCSAPTLDGGFFAPKQETYADGTKLSYTCNEGRKLAVPGWWTMSTCQNGQWSHEPQCIDETSCLPPTIPNAIYDVNSKGWYEEGDKIRIKCLEGYEHKDRHATAVCQNGAWPSLPVCERSTESCSEPPKMPHAVIIDMKSQEVFAEGSELLYECEDGFTTEGTDEKKIYCLYGNWTESRPCRPSSSTGSNEGDSGTFQSISVDKCGRFPLVENGIPTENSPLSLKYTCNDFYKLVGPAIVVCYRNSMWSDVPICKDTSCRVDTTRYPDLKPAGIKILRDGESMKLTCTDVWNFENFPKFSCKNGRVESTECCNRLQLHLVSVPGLIWERYG